MELDLGGNQQKIVTRELELYKGAETDSNLPTKCVNNTVPGN